MSTFIPGTCPLCGSGIFVAAGNWLTCSGDSCPDPSFVADIFTEYRTMRGRLAQREAELATLREAARRVTKMRRWVEPDAWDTNEWNESHDALAALLDGQENV